MPYNMSVHEGILTSAHVPDVKSRARKRVKVTRRILTCVQSHCVHVA